MAGFFSGDGAPLPGVGPDGAPIPYLGADGGLLPGVFNSFPPPAPMPTVGPDGSPLIFGPDGAPGAPAPAQRPVDPGVFGLPAHNAQPQAPSPIEHVIAQLGIHPQSGLASAFRAIHAVLTHHLASQAAAHYGHAGIGPIGGRPGGPVRPGPTLQ